ncbi:Rv3654c family TadE-like protein [Actinomadura sp. DC4]|uniref:Rv3654c family TadE-like protein n=1 Tax=Actinomadura sp. DC4 TaxID=3055069 RepID=UPI0025B1D06B|nr:Rv3654c family TadE-like protein [Actinomadura sp. DC4]MDN3354549.1 flp pilus-assembly TadE/G-like family protein [Actinomadura sp. DC4]
MGDRGSGTVWMLALIGLTWTVAAMAMTVGGVRAARHRAYAAADLAALAAASHASDGPRSACRLAARIARGSGGRLRRCVLHGHVSEVVVVSELSDVPMLGHLTATGQARAGPERVPGLCDPPILCGAPRPSPEATRPSSGLPQPSSDSLRPSPRSSRLSSEACGGADWRPHSGRGQAGVVTGVGRHCSEPKTS